MSLKAGDHLSRFRLYSGWKRLTLNGNTKRGEQRLSMIILVLIFSSFCHIVIISSSSAYCHDFIIILIILPF